MNEALAAIVMAEQAFLLANRLYEIAKAKGEPTPEEWQASFDRATAAADKFRSLHEQAKAEIASNPHV